MLTNPHIGAGRLDPNEPADKGTTIVVNNLAEFLAAIDIPTKRAVEDMVKRTFERDRHLASGGLLKSTGSYFVGERAPELVLPGKRIDTTRLDSKARYCDQLDWYEQLLGGG